MPYVDIIYSKADDQTKRNLKLACKSFWSCHVQEKYFNNYAKSQEPRHWQLYCFGDCENNKIYEVIYVIYYITTDTMIHIETYIITLSQ